MKVAKQVRVHECVSALDAEMAKTTLAEAGITATIQGHHGGQLLGELVPARYPILVGAEQADAARELLRGAGLMEPVPKPPTKRGAAAKTRGGRFVRAIIGFYVFVLLAMAGFAVTAILAVGVADVVHGTPYGHMITSLIPYRYLVVATSLLLTFSRWARERGWVVIVALSLALIVLSVRPRSEPRSTSGRAVPRASSTPW